MKPNKPAKDTYTATEVGTLLESVDQKFKHVMEVVSPLPDRLLAVEGRLSMVETEVRSLKDVIRIAIPDHAKRLLRLETKVGI